MVFPFYNTTNPINIVEICFFSSYNAAMMRVLAWIDQPRFCGWGCSQCAWVFNPLGPPMGDSFDAMRQNFVTCRDEQFASHVCAEYPRERRPAPDAT
jgi:hypothetical protein